MINWSPAVSSRLEVIRHMVRFCNPIFLQTVFVALLHLGRSHADDSPLFEREVISSLTKLGCNSGTCHGSLHGKGGLRLSLRGQDLQADYNAIALELNGRRIDLLDCQQSLILSKPSGVIAHQGGVRLPKDSHFYDAIRNWIEAGAKPVGSRQSPQLVSLAVEPNEVWLQLPNNKQQLTVQASWSDGTISDVTSWSRFETSAIEGASVSELGLVTASKPVDTSVSVFYLGHLVTSRLIFLPKETLQTQSVAEAIQSGEDHVLSNNKIDYLINVRLAKLGLNSSELAPPNVIFRRMFLTVLGRLPSCEEQEAFFADVREQKIHEWVNKLLADPGYSDMWAMRWSDLLRNEPKVMSERGVAKWHEWLREAIAHDKPCNEMVMEMITTLGSTYDNPPASFHRTHRDPTVAAESVGQVFLGIRMQCAKCHNHPFDIWTQDDYYGLAAFFTTLERKAIDNMPKDKLDTHIITGDEIISMTSKSAVLFHPGRSKLISAKGLGEPISFVKEAKETEIGTTELEKENPLTSIANWVGKNNRQFARNIANRVWAHLFGRGIVDPVDDFRNTNPASNPELLEYLTDRLISQNYSIQSLTREILCSQAFSRHSLHHELDPTREQIAVANFAFYPTRRMSAEVLHDAILDFTGTTTQLSHNASANSESKDGNRLRRAVEYPSIPKRDSFLKTFGKPDRLIDCDCERSSDLSLRQSLLLVNDANVRSMLRDSHGYCVKIVESTANSSDPSKAVLGIDQLYRIGFCRPPTDTERESIQRYLFSSSNLQDAIEDVAWAMLNSKEFLFIR